jgi:poly-gamma-glutamate capsule biosynthesis protein CapA/YwtB (metallophosphatase superfamily)
VSDWELSISAKAKTLPPPAAGRGSLGWELDRAAGIVGDLKKKGCVVLVICHCGVEYIPFPPPYVVEAFQYMVDAGADLVIGHHPHVPQGVQLYRGVPICYSLGNFVFYQETELLYRKVGYWVEAGLSSTGVNGISLVPYEIGLTD